MNKIVIYVKRNRKYKTEVSTIFIYLFYFDIFVNELGKQ